VEATDDVDAATVVAAVEVACPEVAEVEAAAVVLEAEEEVAAIEDVEVVVASNKSIMVTAQSSPTHPGQHVQTHVTFEHSPFPLHMPSPGHLFAATSVAVEFSHVGP
jgi:hypothetical protein